MSIDVDGLYRIHAGQVLAFTDETGLLLNGASPILANEGKLSLTVDAAGDPVGLVVATSDDATVWNRAGGLIAVHVDAGVSTEVDPFGFGGAGAHFRNDGVIAVEGDQVRAFIAGGAGLHFDNHGRFEVTGVDSAGLGMMRGDADIANSGLIRVEAATAVGFTVLGGGTVDAGAFTNTGKVLIAAQDGAIGLLLSDATDGYHFDNSGRFIVTASDPDGVSTGVVLPSHTDAATFVENSGLIRANVALRDAMLGQSLAPATVDNSGRIFGDIDLGGAGDRVVNTGLIVGDIELSYGDDVYAGGHGRLQGVVYGGGGDDVLHGGRGLETLYGDSATADGHDGADLIKGGGGGDTIFGGAGADTLNGGLGGDHLDGGAGADVFIYRQIDDSRPGGGDLISGLDASDIIDLSHLDADATTAGNQAFAQVSAFTGHAGELTLTFDGTSSLLQADVDGDGFADFAIALSGDQSGFTGLVL